VAAANPSTAYKLDPRFPPVQGLLARPARLLDELNRRLGDADAAIGPSCLMKPSIYARVDAG
jgi:5-methylcytosine-specific restriction protein B